MKDITSIVGMALSIVLVVGLVAALTLKAHHEQGDGCPCENRTSATPMSPLVVKRDESPMCKRCATSLGAN